jgi:tripartite-type tricarboxylate transporter receptor subunit TctC
VKIKHLYLVASLLMGMLPGAGAWAQPAYPTKLITIVAGYPAGTPVDTVARLIATKLADRVGQPVIVENKPGAGSSLGAIAVLKAPPDGYTLYLSSIANSVNPSFNKLTFDFQTDLAPVTMVSESPMVLAVHPSLPSTVKDFVAEAKKKPGQFAFGSSGTGTATHLFAELFAYQTGIKLTHVPYKGSSQTVTDLLAGRIQLMFSPGGTVLPHIKAGTLRGLALSGRQRLTSLPDVPTFAEAGVKGLDSALWFGLNAPAGTPAPIIAYLNKEVGAVLNLPDVKASLIAQMIFTAPSTSEAFGKFIREDTERWARVVKAAGIKAGN